MICSHIVAVSKNGVIGIDNRLPWKMPRDVAYFNRITKGHCVIMGRKNYEANKKALPDRTNIVISGNMNYHLEDSIVVHSIDEALNRARQSGEKEAFIVGGGEIYKQTRKIVDRIYITVIDTVVKGDTLYPLPDFSKWRILSEIPMQKDENHPFNYTYYILLKP
ncbi:MAG: dihydrofolate reductase [Bacteroidales bacterium]|nr:dihydrofolate reductase [Bacteroidales bacterium]MBN2697808.1 dihydrofolate reductase [Bacteroidales bacterium]